MTNPVVHFEMPADDRKRMSEFYTKAFGWKTEQLGPEMGNYVMVQTTETDEKGFPKERGMINGGFYDKTDAGASNAPSVVISVSDINEYIKKVNDAGGKVLDGPTDIPGIGQYASFLDTEGNRVGMLQAAAME